MTDRGLPLLAWLVLPYSRLELPGWGFLLRRAGVYEPEDWKSAPRRMMRGKWHGYRMELDLSKGFDRYSYFLGRCYDLTVQLALRRAVHEGDVLVDIGANAGMITLLGAKLVGPSGEVMSFEPNPAAFQRLKSNVECNGLTHVRLEPCGLSDQPGELVLRVPLRNDGEATLAELDPVGDVGAFERVVVRVLRGDDVLTIPADRPMAIKIDVEGFECRVLRGLERTLLQNRPLVITEAIPEHLARAGSGLNELFGLMMGHGFRPYELGLYRKWGRHQLRLRALSDHKELTETDVAWVHPAGTHMARLF